MATDEPTADESARLSAFLLSLNEQSSKDEQSAREHSHRMAQLLKEQLSGKAVQAVS